MSKKKTITILNNITKSRLLYILSQNNIKFKNPQKYNKNQMISMLSTKYNIKIKNNIETFISLAQGYRPYMEDNIYYMNSNQIIFSSIFDGHGGSECSLYLKRNLYRLFQDAIKKYSTIVKSLKISYITANKIFLSKRKKSGSTCNTLIISKKTNNYYIANTGDSRTIAYTKNKKVIQLTKDHSPTDRIEKKMVLKRGGFIRQRRVDGILAMTRSMGDIKLSKHITCIPDIFSGSTKNILYFVQASDGLYDVMTNRQICLYINKLLKNKVSKKKIPEELIKHALYKGSTDNISVILTFI